MRKKEKADFTGEKILFIGASGHFEPAITKARELGAYTIAINYNPGAFAKRYADLSADVDTYLPEEVLRFARDQKVNGVFTSWNEVNLYTTEYVARELGVPFYARKDQLDALVTKYSFKQTCRKYGVSVIPEFFVGNRLLEEDIQSFDYPVIFKPTDSGGTRGMTILYDEGGIKEASEKALEASIKKEFVVEKYLRNGQLIVIDLAIQNGEAYLACVADRSIVRTSEAAVPLAISYMYPSKHIGIVREQVFESLRRLVRGLGIQNGIISFEGMISEGRLYLIESQFRFGGTHFYRFTERGSGVDLLEMMLEYALSGSFDRYDLAKDLHPEFKDPYACQNLQVDSGRIREIRNIDRVREMPGVDWFVQIKDIGDQIPADGSTAQNFAKIGLSAKTDRELYRLMDKIQHTLEVIDENGKNLVRKNVPAEYL